MTTATYPITTKTSNPWAMVPALGDLNAYIAAAQRMPMLSAEEERNAAQEFRQQGDINAAGRLVLSHLRLVIAISRQYLGYGLPQADLIQEGNIGLMKAVKRFDPDQGVRLVSYAMHWIKAEIHEYILKNWRMVKVATTKAQRKLFFNLRSMKNAMQDADEDSLHRSALNSAQVQEMAQRLSVKPEEVREMELRMQGADVVLDPSPSDDGEESFAPIAWLADDSQEPTALLEAREREAQSDGGVQTALAKLDERSRRIVQARWLDVQDDGSGGATLHELAAEYGVSAERIRQIEVQAMKKMKQHLLQYSPA